MDLNEAYWAEQYRQNVTGWDARNITTPIKEYVDQLPDKNIRILVPGCGYGHEVKYLYDQGFTDVTVIDLAAQPLAKLQEYCKDWAAERFIQGDFFDHQGEYELIIEQTFFCALDPALRQAYADKMYDLLVPGGKLAGVLFGIPLGDDGPPYGGNKEEYLGYFSKKFTVKVMELCYNSIKPRAGNELFIILEK